MQKVERKLRFIAPMECLEVREIAGMPRHESLHFRISRQKALKV